MPVCRASEAASSAPETGLNRPEDVRRRPDLPRQIIRFTGSNYSDKVAPLQSIA